MPPGPDQQRRVDRPLRSGAEDRGAAVVDFVFVSILMVLLLFGVLQVAVYFYVRNVVTASAAEGARYGANADVDAGAGGPKTEQLIGGALGSGVQSAMHCQSGVEAGAAGSELVVVRCDGELKPIFAPVKHVLPVHVTARALKEGTAGQQVIP